MRTRQSARLIIVDDQDRLLLMKIDDGREIDPNQPGRTDFWITFGGGLEPGETFEAAAARELFEETGIAGIPVGPCLWDLQRVAPWTSETVFSHERYFLVRTDAQAVDLSRLLDDERAVYREHRWWAIDELRDTGEIQLPFGFPRLADLLAPVLAGHIPAPPLRLE